MRISADAVFAIMREHITSNRNLSNGLLNRRCVAKFGCTPDLVHLLWNEIVRYGTLPEKSTFKHLLWTLDFLKTYNTYSFYASQYKVAENTFMKWTWKFILAIARMKHLVRIYSTFL
jgi:hypothetical protein